MLKNQTLEQIATLLKIKKADLEAAIKAEAETDIEIDANLQTFSESDLKTLKNNSYKEGKAAGIEMEVDAVKKAEGLEFTGKTVAALLEAKAAKVIADAKIEPDKKVRELETKVATLTTTVSDYESQIAAKDAEINGIRVNSELYQHIPSFGDKGPALGADDVIQLMKASGYEAKMEDGKTVFYKAGAKLTDKLGNATAPKDVISAFIAEKKLAPVEGGGAGGRGAGDGGGASASSLTALKAKFTAEGKSLLGQEFSQAVQEAAKVDGFVMS